MAVVVASSRTRRSPHLVGPYSLYGPSGPLGQPLAFWRFFQPPGVRIVSYLCRRWSEVFNPAICPSLVPCWESIELPALMRFPFFLVYTFHFYIYRPTLCSYPFPIHYFH